MNENFLFITCAEGLEKLLMDELEGFGLNGLRMSRHGIYAPLSIQNTYKINYLSRFATRVLWPLKAFKCKGRDDLYNAAASINWPLFFSVKETFAIDANVFESPTIRHSLFASLVVKDGICDVFREETEERPSVDTSSPTVQLHLFIHKEKALLSLDTSGKPLHKRGYRTHPTIASLHETLAAAILKLSNYSWKDTFYDPCCGSGTFLIEAALMATQTPPGFLRKSWGFSRLPEHKQEIWEKIKQTADEKTLPLSPGQISGSDVDAGVVRAAKDHIANAGFSASISVECISAETLKISRPISLLVSNPPYGKRLPLSETLFRALYSIPANRKFLLLPEATMPKSRPLKNGGEKVSLCEIS